MTQIKLFKDTTPDMEKFESQVNTFLQNEGRIIVKDIKLTAESPNPNNHAWKSWAVMVIYELKQ